MLYIKQGNYYKVIHSSHEKYGPVVCVSPNVPSLDFLSLTKIIYNAIHECHYRSGRGIGSNINNTARVQNGSTAVSAMELSPGLEFATGNATGNLICHEI